MTAPARLNEPAIVNVALAGRSYGIVIGRGQLHTLGQRIASLRPGARAAIVSDETVVRHHLDAAQGALSAAGIPSTCISVPPGEKSKSFQMLERVCEQLLEERLERGDIVIALGGGVVGDLAGFAAAIVRRGLDYIQIPTTLLAQVDSAVGGKTAIDTQQGKNLVGAFHQPILVICDTALLDTLADREFRSGYAEVVKYGLIADAGFFGWLEQHWRELFAGGPAREQAIAKSCRMKADIVAKDERETGERALLNLGHTFGHALEAAAGLDRSLLHGEAISVGMILAFQFSSERGLMGEPETYRVRQHFGAVGLPAELSALPMKTADPDVLMEFIAQDKKVKQGKLTFILARGIGAAFVAPNIAASDVRAFLTRKLAER